MLRLLVLVFLLHSCVSYAFRSGLPLRAMQIARHARNRASETALTKPPAFVVGVDVPEEVAKQSAIYDMILVERCSSPERTDVGLFLPVVEGKDQKHLGKVLSVPSDYGLESEQGRLQPIAEIAPYKVGDCVYIKDPWGVGPLQMEVGQRCFSFHKAEHITGVVR